MTACPEPRYRHGSSGPHVPSSPAPHHQGRPRVGIQAARSGAMPLQELSLGVGLLRCLVGLVVITLLSLGLFPLTAAPAWALIHAHPDETTATGVVRSLESLRDLDYQSWQVVAYRQETAAGTPSLRLRLVGFPGKVRIDHPTSLQVRSGRRQWQLVDVTLSQPQLAADSRSAAAEFDLRPLLADLDQDRPLRLSLPGVFLELPVPPFVVAEWRRLPDWGPGDQP